MQYGCFAVVYLMMSNDCVDGISQLDHAFFFSVQTAATIGASCIALSPDYVQYMCQIVLYGWCSLWRGPG